MIASLIGSVNAVICKMAPWATLTLDFLSPFLLFSPNTDVQGVDNITKNVSSDFKVSYQSPAVCLIRVQTTCTFFSSPF